MKKTPIFTILAAAVLLLSGASGQVRNAQKAVVPATISPDGVKAFDELGLELARLVDAQRCSTSVSSNRCRTRTGGSPSSATS